MPTVLCGLPCFDAPALSTAGAAAQEFFSSLNSALEGAVCAVEVYRLERLEPEAQLAAEDTVVCYVPGWGFDFSSLEDLHNELEELRGENDTLLMQNSRTNEVLVSLNYAVEAAEAAEAGQRLAEKSRDSYREVVQLKQQLARSERKQQETKATVIALRSEFMQLVGMLTDTGAPANPCGMEVPNVLKENVRSGQHDIIDKFSDVGSVDMSKPSRHVSQPVRRPAGSPCATRGGCIGGGTNPRPAARPRGTHQRGIHSAGASARQRVQQSDGA
eukprot:TRINITY_DN29524_c0_g1_i1.p1 TRINITY_DN29524_c0_g1~~TRINITY_DN29524_c0_g1_i1.p1  ORF type:complete len:304 (+),score=63.74 TRINITY_DN29524_c0_g1_i1:94-912(+)